MLTSTRQGTATTNIERQLQKNGTTDPSTPKLLPPSSLSWSWFTPKYKPPTEPDWSHLSPSPTAQTPAHLPPPNSPYKVLFQRLPRQRPSAIKRMASQIGFPPHLARHLIFLTQIYYKWSLWLQKPDLRILESISTRSAVCLFVPLKGALWKFFRRWIMTNQHQKLPFAHETSCRQAGRRNKLNAISKTYLLFPLKFNWI